MLSSSLWRLYQPPIVCVLNVNRASCLRVENKIRANDAPRPTLDKECSVVQPLVADSISGVVSCLNFNALVTVYRVKNV
jgi:hypothetical protein